jgi:hypothetical protein
VHQEARAAGAGAGGDHRQGSARHPEAGLAEQGAGGEQRAAEGQGGVQLAAAAPFEAADGTERGGVGGDGGDHGERHHRQALPRGRRQDHQAAEADEQHRQALAPLEHRHLAAQEQVADGEAAQVEDDEHGQGDDAVGRRMPAARLAHHQDDEQGGDVGDHRHQRGEAGPATVLAEPDGGQAEQADEEEGGQEQAGRPGNGDHGQGGGQGGRPASRSATTRRSSGG